jgi:hypothetical protein
MSATRSRAGCVTHWLAAAVATAALVGCGGAAAQSVSSRKPTVSSSPPQAALCQAIGLLDGLAVDRTNTLQDKRIRYRFAPAVTVSEPGRAQIVARALCALPRLPAGPFACPADTGTVYLLRFSSRGRRFPTVTAEATGCEIVHGLGAARWTPTTPGFWYTLGKVMGIQDPGRATFAGAVPPKSPPVDSPPPAGSPPSAGSPLPAGSPPSAGSPLPANYPPPANRPLPAHRHI